MESSTQVSENSATGKNSPRFWPLSAGWSVVCSVVLMVLLFVVVAVLQEETGWPGGISGNAVFIAAVVGCLFPVILAVLDMIVQRGGSIEYHGVKIDFSEVRQEGLSGITVPANIGLSGQAVVEGSGTVGILAALKQAQISGVTVIDLEDGQAWWETRLLVLLAGAARFGQPGIVVFVTTQAAQQQRFQGWGYTGNLLGLLLQADPQYAQCYHSARAAARQLELVEPPMPGCALALPQWMTQPLAVQGSSMIIDNTTGLPNEFLQEQLLAMELADKVERPQGGRPISLIALGVLFGNGLVQSRVDQGWLAIRQLQVFLGSDTAYVAVTDDGRYVTMVSRTTILNEVVKQIVARRSTQN